MPAFSVENLMGFTEESKVNIAAGKADRQSRQKEQTVPSSPEKTDKQLSQNK